MTENSEMIERAVARLNARLPLRARQENLPAPLKTAHRQILHSLAGNGRPPTEAELTAVLGAGNLKVGLQRLGSDDLVVLDARGQMPLGAYPITTEQTPHRISINGHHIYAMCALDAVAVAPMFSTEVKIESSCHLTQAPIVIHMRNSEVLEVLPGPDVTIGVRWQTPSAVAAHSMCLQMVFLRDRDTAGIWQQGDRDAVSLFSLPEAVAFGKAFFLPLLD